VKALTIGGAMIDTIAIIDSKRIERMAMSNADSSFLLLEEGHKTEAQDVSTHCGGGAVNAAVSMSRLGLDVSALVKVGRDQRAETLMARLMEEGVSPRWVVRDHRAPTGASVLVSSHDRNAAVFTFRGANTLLEPDDLPDDAFSVDAVYISGLSNNSAKCFPLILEKARAHGALVAANPGLRQLSAHGNAFQDCLGMIDILALNRVEADALVPKLVTRVGEGGAELETAPGQVLPSLALKGLSSGGFDMTLLGFLKGVASFGPRYVVLTDGSRGAFVGTQDTLYYCPAATGQVMGTAGAGDAFTSTFAAFIALGEAPDQALRAATLNAGSVVGYVDTQTGLLTADALRAVLATDVLPVQRWSL
jgi:ribokinase